MLNKISAVSLILFMGDIYWYQYSFNSLNKDMKSKTANPLTKLAKGMTDFFATTRKRNFCSC